ncbi:Outer-membrane lipoprotein carrier protein [Commensalibacter sp. Nvir]|uniref:LolA family protein n=1 Tax=Commensalibacter sp. Nvir TaxID=3069817 RepID=UPI002D2AC6BD|nr:Outer-membrane lipoprotein carrier protein [Commensalibacter sp. Nvir]
MHLRYGLKTVIIISLACFCIFSQKTKAQNVDSAASFANASSSIVRAFPLKPDEQAWVNQAQNWINALTTLRARFQQIAFDNRSSTGTVWIKRPGRIRFEYNKPSQIVLVANHGKMVFHDGEVDQTTTIPLDQNPLGLLLNPQLSFTGSVTITNFSTNDRGLFQITLVRTLSPSEGNLTLIFNQTPLFLKAWQVVDAQGHKTQVDLYDLNPDISIKENIFKLDFND